MAFPLFGKKPPAPVAKTPVKRPAAPRPVTEAARAPQQGNPDKPARAKVPSLDFTRPGDLPGKNGAESAKIEVQDAGHQMPPAIEQAAMLYSVEQPEAACAALEAAIREPGLGAHAQRAWGMLFDLYQLLGRKPAHEQLALAYAARFETSPPAWQEGGGDAHHAPAAAGSRAAVVLTGALNAKTRASLLQLLKFAEKAPTVRLELGKLTDADEEGCGLLYAALLQLKKARRECVLGGADKLVDILDRKIAPGQRSLEKIWLLILELHQRRRDQQAFEEAAVNYAVTFEMSPPSWEPPAETASPEAEPGAEVEETAGCALEGDITAASSDAFVAIQVQAEKRSEVIVDVSRLRRMDFVAAANLMNLIGSLAAAKKRVRLIKASHLLTGLWEVIGLDRVARIETRKT